jgi:hypothetical protein
VTERFELGDGIELREWIPADAEEAFAEIDQNRERLRDWLPWVDLTHSPDDVRSFIERCAASEGKQRSFGIYVDGVLAGNIGLSLNEDNAGEIGYWMAGAFEGRGRTTMQVARTIRQLWGNGKVTPPPAQDRVPIWIGVSGAWGARQAGRQLVLVRVPSGSHFRECGSPRTRPMSGNRHDPVDRGARKGSTS